jgi:hypothetical protein
MHSILGCLCDCGGRNLVIGFIGLSPISEILYKHNNPALPELLADLGSQRFYGGDILQQLLRQAVPLL